MTTPYLPHPVPLETLVIKIGGSLLRNLQESLPLVAKAIDNLLSSHPNLQVAIVHGGGPHIHSALSHAAIATTCHEGYRITPAQHMPLVEKVLFDQLYQQLYTHFQALNRTTHHWSSPHQLPLTAQQKKAPDGTPHWGCVGDHLVWDLTQLQKHLKTHKLLLLPSLAPSADGLYNINADDMATSLAIALKAQGLLYITDVPAVLDHLGNPIHYLTPDRAQALIDQGTLRDGMKLKVLQGLKALQHQIPSVHLVPLDQLGKAFSHHSGTRLLPAATPTHNHIMPTYNRRPLTFVAGKGPWLYTETGQAFLDMVSGVAVNTLGHAHPALVEAISQQAQQLWHLSNLYYTKEVLRLAERLTGAGDFQHAFFSNSGTEAVEAALKIARKHGRGCGAYKRKIIYLSGSFHGRTLGALTVTANVHYQAPFLPLVGDTEEVPSGDITALRRAMSDDVCALILEPIQGESGVHPVDAAFIKEARTLCDKHKALLIFDEVQSGIGRTGTLFYHEQLHVSPDVLCLAKGLGGGFPIGATLTRASTSVLEPGDHGSTFGGNPLAAACANTVLDCIANEGLLDHVKALGHLARTTLTHHPQIQRITGSGLFLGLHLHQPAALVIAAAEAQGLLLIGAGPNTVRLLPPLNISREDFTTALQRLCTSLDTFPLPCANQVV